MEILFEHIPDDVIWLIFRRFSPPQLLICRLISKRYRDLIRNKIHLWKQAPIKMRRIFPKIGAIWWSNDDVLNEEALIEPIFKLVVAPLCHNVINTGLVELINNHSSSLKYLYFDEYSSIYPTDWVHKATRLEVLSISNPKNQLYQSDQMLCTLRELTKLTTLKIKNVGFFDIPSSLVELETHIDYNLLPMIEKCSNLKTLKGRNITSSRYIDLNEFFSRCSGLTSLYAKCKVESLLDSTVYNSLNRLHIMVDAKSHELYRALNCLPNLRSLSVTFELYLITIDAHVEQECFSKMTQLETLTFKFEPAVIQSDVIPRLTNLQYLECLSGSDRSNISMVAWQSLSRLRQLVIDWHYSDFPSLPLLETLEVPIVRLPHISTGLTKLTCLCVDSYLQPTQLHGVVESIDLPCLRNLKKLFDVRLASIEQVTNNILEDLKCLSDSSFNNYWPHLTNLTSLILLGRRAYLNSPADLNCLSVLTRLENLSILPTTDHVRFMHNMCNLRRFRLTWLNKKDPNGESALSFLKSFNITRAYTNNIVIIGEHQSKKRRYPHDI